MKYTPLSNPDIILMEPQVFSDHRGFFMETFREDAFQKNISPVCFVQDNHSRSTRGILRGLHYQIKQPQGKLVRVVSGAVFDVAVDLRKSSPFFGKWVGMTLTSETGKCSGFLPGLPMDFMC